MPGSTHIAIFAVHQSTSDLQRQLRFYLDRGFIVDYTLEPIAAVPAQYYESRGVNKDDLVRSVALKQPADPYMHLIINEWKDLKKGPKWPATYDQIGSRAITFLVGNVHDELARIKKDYPDTKVILEPLEVPRRCGKTRSAIVVDPEGVQLELLEVEPGSIFDPKNAIAPKFNQKAWLHFMYMCENFQKTNAFYESFGMSHDRGVDTRPTGWEPSGGMERFFKQNADAFDGFDNNQCRGFTFLRSPRDCSHMHLELIDMIPGYLPPPGPVPKWSSLGIVRYCYKSPDYASDRQFAKDTNTTIFIEDQRQALYWGDTQWMHFADPDNNCLTFEQWFPHRYFGERE